MGKIVRGMYGTYEEIESEKQGGDDTMHSAIGIDLNLMPNTLQGARRYLGQEFAADPADAAIKEYLRMKKIHTTPAQVSDQAPENQTEEEAINAGIRAADAILRQNPKSVSALNAKRYLKGEK